MGKKIAIRVFNIIIVALCITSIVGYFVMDFFTFKIKYKMTASDFSTILQQSEKTKDYIEYVDDVVGDGKDIVISIKIPFKLLKNSFNVESPEKYISENLTDRAVDDFVDSIQDIISGLVQVATKSIAKEEVKTSAQDYVKEVLPDLADDEVELKLEEAGVTNEYLEEKVEQVFETISTEGTPVTEVVQETITVVEEVFQKLSDSGIGTKTELTEQEKNDIEETLTKAFEEFSLIDENGNMKDIKGDAESILNAILNKYDGSLGDAGGTMGGGEQGEQAQPKSEKVVSSVKNSLYSVTFYKEISAGETSKYGTAQEDEIIQEEITIRGEVKRILSQTIAPSSKIIIKVFNVMFYVVCASAFLWLWHILKIIIKAFRKNPAIKFWFVVLYGWIPQLVLGLIPTLVMVLAPILLGKIGGEQILTLINSIDITAWTSGIIASISALVLFILSFPYSIIRRRLRREIRLEKKEQKNKNQENSNADNLKQDFQEQMDIPKPQPENQDKETEKA